MSTKLEVVSTVSETIRFAFTKIPMTLRLGWLGLVIAGLIITIGMFISFGAVGGLGFFERLSEMGDANEFDPMVIPLILHFYGSMFLWILLACLAMVPFTVVMKQVAAGTIEPPSGFAWFRVSGREVSFVFANILFGILKSVVMAILLAPGILALVYAFIGGLSPDVFEMAAADPEAFGEAVEANVEGGGFGPSLLVAMLAFLAGIILFVWFLVRACLFTTVAAVEGKWAPFSAFGLTGGNFWRIIGAGILFVLAVMVIEIVFTIAIAMIAGIGGGVFAALFSDAGGAATGVGILVGLVLLVVFLAYLIFMIALELAFPAKIYASLTRDESAA